MIVQVKGTCSLSKSIVERLLYLEAKVSTPLRDTLSKQHSSLIQHTRAELMEVDPYNQNAVEKIKINVSKRLENR